MNDGIKILLDRMVTHPEEFVDATNLGATKWSGLLNYYDNVLTNEERLAIQSGMREIKRDAFTKQVMERLLDEQVQIDPHTYTFNTVGRSPWNAPALLADNYATTSGKLAVEIQKEQLEQIKQIMKDELQQATKKRSR